MNVVSQLHSGTEDETRSKRQENLDSLDVLFSRYRRVLYRVAYRVLDNHQDAKDAVRNCLLAASCSVPQFENEGAFRSWLVRVLIDEALAILYKERIGTTMPPEPILDLFIQGVRGEGQTSCP
jgi:DNA-directed RNA polymerase specialized sigma24 family protein